MVDLTDQKQPLPRGAGDMVRYVARRLPPVVALRRWSYERHFANAAGEQRLFRGVYPDFPTAIASAPAAHPIGYDNKASAHRLAEERHHVFPTDYPVLFWLAHLIGENTVLFDLGGNVGSRYLAFRNHLTYRDSLRWIVSEVPAVVELGREIAARENAPHLGFTTGFDELNGAHILLASGVLQFLDDWIGFLRAVPNRPPHVLINRTPVYAGEFSGDAAFHWHGVLSVPSLQPVRVRRRVRRSGLSAGGRMGQSGNWLLHPAAPLLQHRRL